MSTAPPSHFRTTETGDLPCPHGTLKFVTVKSPALAARADVTLYIPDLAEGHTDLPVVILLHGVYGSHWAWALSGNAHATLQELIDTGEIPPMILAMPSDGLWGDGSGYIPHASQDFEKWITDDVPKLVSEVTGNSSDTPHFIAGLSMGGYGALRLGAKHPDRFQAFSGHSSITDLNQMTGFTEEPIEQLCASFNQPESIIDAILKNRESLRPFRFDCGTDDPLLQENRRLAKKLDQENINFTYEEFPGGHEWPYWQTHLRESLQFFGSQL